MLISGCLFFLALELVGPNYRSFITVMTCMFYTLGLVLLSGVTYYVRNWVYLALATSTPFTLYFIYWWQVKIFIIVLERGHCGFLVRITHVKIDFALQVPAGIAKMVAGQRPDRRGVENTRNSCQDQRDRASRFVQKEA